MQGYFKVHCFKNESCFNLFSRVMNGYYELVTTYNDNYKLYKEYNYDGSLRGLLTIG